MKGPLDGWDSSFSQHMFERAAYPHSTLYIGLLPCNSDHQQAFISERSKVYCLDSFVSYSQGPGRFSRFLVETDIFFKVPVRCVCFVDVFGSSKF